YRISDLINSTVNSATLLRRIVRETVEVFSAEGGYIAFSAEGQSVLTVEVVQGELASGLADGDALEADHVAYTACQKGKVVASGQGEKSGLVEMATPLRGEGKCMGALVVWGAAASEWADDD